MSLNKSKISPQAQHESSTICVYMLVRTNCFSLVYVKVVCLLFCEIVCFQGPSESSGLREQAVPRAAAVRVGEERRGGGPGCVGQHQARTAVPAGEAGATKTIVCCLGGSIRPVDKTTEEVQDNSRTTCPP